MVPLGEYAHIKGRIGWRGLKSSEYTDTGPYLIAGNHLKGMCIDWTDCDHLSQERYNESSEIQLTKNDIIISKDGTIGRLGFIDWLPGPATINSTMMLIRPNTEFFFSKFIYFYLQGNEFQNLVKEKISGSSVPHIFQRDMVTLQVPLINVHEQKKIAEILTSIDRVIELTEKEIAKLKDLRFAFAENELNPRKWGTIQLFTILSDVQNSMRGGPFGSKFRKVEWAKRGTPYLGIDNIHKEYFKKDFKRFVSSKKLPELELYTTFPFDVVVTIMGTIGRCCIIPDDGNSYISSKHLRTMTIDRNKYNVNLLCFQLNYSSWVWKQYADGSQGGTMDAINNDVLKKLALPDIPFNEQERIVKVLSSIKENIDRKNCKLIRIKNLKKSLMQDLLTGKVRVKV